MDASEDEADGVLFQGPQHRALSTLCVRHTDGTRVYLTLHSSLPSPEALWGPFTSLADSYFPPL